jgi:hypothetical protein
MQDNKYLNIKQAVESLIKLQKLFPNTSICHLNIDAPNFFPEVIRYKHQDLGIVIIVGQPAFLKN